MLCKLVVTY